MQVHIAVRLVANCYTPSTLLYTNQSIDPLLVALHAVAGVDHNKLSSVVNAALVTPDLTFGTQHPELTNSHNNNMLISWQYTVSSLLSKSWNQSTDFIITNIPTRYMYLSFHTIACFKKRHISNNSVKNEFKWFLKCRILKASDMNGYKCVHHTRKMLLRYLAAIFYLIEVQHALPSKTHWQYCHFIYTQQKFQFTPN